MTNQPASTAPLAAGLPHVQGRCPACGTKGLFLGDGGYITCSLIDCPQPDAATEVIADFWDARQHGTFSFCAQDVGHVTMTEFAKKITEKVTAVHQRKEAVEYANAQKQRAEQAEAANTRIRALAARIRQGAAPWTANDDDIADHIVAALDGQAPADADRPHIYLSTGCYHGDHAYCQAMTGLNGAKRPASCKKCSAPCVCPCHRSASPVSECGPACTEQHAYDWTCALFAGVDDSDPADLTGYLAPDPPIGCLTITTEPTPSQRPDLHAQLADAIRTAACDGSCNQTEDECARQRIQPIVWHHGRLAEVSGSPEQFADVVLTLLYQEWPWLRAAAEDAVPPAAT